MVHTAFHILKIRTPEVPALEAGVTQYLCPHSAIDISPQMFGEFAIQVAADRLCGFFLSIKMDFRSGIASLKCEELTFLTAHSS